MGPKGSNLGPKPNWLNHKARFFPPKATQTGPDPPGLPSGLKLVGPQAFFLGSGGEEEGLWPNQFGLGPNLLASGGMECWVFTPLQKSRRL